MPSLSLTDLVDVVSRSGTPKATKVAEIKNRAPYQPATDFYKPLRDRLIELHKAGKGRSALAELLDGIHDQKKLTNYPDALEGYHKWWGKKAIQWFDPPRNPYGHAGIEIAVNPELGLTIDGTRFVVKLYMKADPLSKLRVDLITVLMEVALRPKCEPGDQLALLDMRRAKLFTVSAPIPTTRAMVDAELAYVASLWPNI
ncbi:MAG TPA: hypothetical protein VF584_02980 [Longimicrobium sp.]|jgi:hypothetical protein